MIPTHFYQAPFATAGDVTTVPLNDPGDGSVNYEEGYGSLYQQDPAAGGLNIERQKFNELLLTATTNIQEYQVWGVPNFISTSDNGGSPYSYSKYCRALFNDGTNGPRVFISNQNSNTDTPTTGTVISSKWILQDTVSFQATTFNNVVFDAAVMQDNAVYWDVGSSKYKQALANGVAQQQALGIADVANNRVIAFGITPGLSGLTPGAIYYLSTTSAGAITSVKPASNVVQIGIARDATTLFLNVQIEIPGAFLPVGTSLNFRGASAPDGYLLEDGSAISRTTYAVLFGVIGTTYGPGDGSTTFNLPDSRRRVDVGSGGTGSGELGNVTGNTGGEETHVQSLSELAAHSHGITDPGHTHNYVHYTSNNLGSASGAAFFVTNNNDTTTSAFTGISVNTEGSSAGFNVIQPSLVATRMIFTGVF